MKLIRSILIANRGEIASRIIRTCKKMGIRSIAIYSEVDATALYVQHADIAVCIGQSESKHSYLNMDKIISVAQEQGADAIHPGYGFLSERADFAKRCHDEKIVFIGPNIEAISAMGSKSFAKALMAKHDVPIVPGYHGEDQELSTLISQGNKIGYPLLIKAVAGGGGKGMRIVREEQELSMSIEAAQSEALSSFGSSDVILEKYIPSSRHIEFQIFGDQHGNVIHLLERECTIQRRYQKIIEESPSSVLSEKLRTKMGASAVKAAKAISYDNAGTVEFIYDETTQDYFFLEVNTRLQVEHPVTEAITGLDLVRMQIESAQGFPLSIQQEDVVGEGYALECRLYAEDVSNDFMPVTGQVLQFKYPVVDGFRIETGLQAGIEISIFYDPMVAKLIVHDKDRYAAIRKMAYVLDHMACLGTITNQQFLKDTVGHPLFLNGDYDSSFIRKHSKELIGRSTDESEVFKAAIATTLFSWSKRETERGLLKSISSGWRNNFYTHQSETYEIGGEEVVVNYKYEHGIFTIPKDGDDLSVILRNATKDSISIVVEDVVRSYDIICQNGVCYLHNEQSGNIMLQLKPRFPDNDTNASAGGYEAPMPSQVIKVLVTAGDQIEVGDSLIVLSSMKMENTISANSAGIIDEVYVTAGDNIAAGMTLLKVSS